MIFLFKRLIQEQQPPTNHVDFTSTFFIYKLILKKKNDFRDITFMIILVKVVYGAKDYMCVLIY